MTDCRTPQRLQPEHIRDFLAVLSTALWTAHAQGHDLRIAQIIGNLGDNYYVEDAEYVAKVRERLASLELCQPH